MDLKIIIACALLAYLIVKVHEYYTAAKQLKSDLKSEQAKNININEYQQQIQELDDEILNFKSEIEKAKKAPDSRSKKRSLRTLKTKINKLQNEKAQYQNALDEYIKLMKSGKKTREDTVATLNKYVHNKRHH